MPSVETRRLRSTLVSIPDFIIMIPYVYIGFLCAVGGTIWASKLQGVQSTLGAAYEMDAISAVVIGGTSMSGGSGTVGGTLIGIFNYCGSF